MTTTDTAVSRSASSPQTAPQADRQLGSLSVVPFAHPMGCRGYLVGDDRARRALAIDAHLDLVDAMRAELQRRGWTLALVVDTHTHADHASGSRALAAATGAERVAHEAAGHAGVSRHPADGEALMLGERLLGEPAPGDAGDTRLVVRHAPGHTPDHMALVLHDGDAHALFSGDSLFIGGVARTDFLGGDAGTLFDTLRRLLPELPDDTVLFPGHDYAGRIASTLGDERRDNPWLAMTREAGQRDAFVAALTANPPPEPDNMAALLAANRAGEDFPEAVEAAEAMARVAAGGARSVLDVRTPGEVASEGIDGAVAVPLDRLAEQVDTIAAMPAPRLLLCRSGARATQARDELQRLGLGGLSVITGGLIAWRAAGGPVREGDTKVISLERQVRIGAGALVLLGIALGLFVHPALLGLSAFVGAGLVFAGVTDWCGMGLLLARAPWNQRGAQPGAPAAAGGTCAATAPPGTCAATPPPATGGTCAATPPPATGGTCAASPPPES